MTTPRRSGLLYAIGAYVLWGLLPLYFLALAPVGPWELVALRILLSLLFCGLLIAVTRSWRRFGALLKHRRTLVLFGIAGALIWVNWTVYVTATLSNHVIEASLGYFMNPLVTIFLGVFLLRERLRPLQWVAVAMTFVAVLTLAIGYGHLPWLALALAFSFGLYGFVKKKAGPAVDAVSGLTLETLWLAPVAIVQLSIVGATSGLVIGNAGTLNLVLLSLAGIITAVPLLMFGAAARRLPLVHLGLFQFAAPVMQFIVGLLFLHEAMNAARWTGFAIVWIACALLIVDAIRTARSAAPQPSVAMSGDETDPLGTLGLEERTTS